MVSWDIHSHELPVCFWRQLFLFAVAVVFYKPTVILKILLSWWTASDFLRVHPHLRIFIKSSLFRLHLAAFLRCASWSVFPSVPGFVPWLLEKCFPSSDAERAVDLPSGLGGRRRACARRTDLSRAESSSCLVLPLSWVRMFKSSAGGLWRLFNNRILQKINVVAVVWIVFIYWKKKKKLYKCSSLGKNEGFRHAEWRHIKLH